MHELQDEQLKNTVQNQTMKGELQFIW